MPIFFVSSPIFQSLPRVVYLLHLSMIVQNKQKHLTLHYTPPSIYQQQFIPQRIQYTIASLGGRGMAPRYPSILDKTCVCVCVRVNGNGNVNVVAIQEVAIAEKAASRPQAVRADAGTTATSPEAPMRRHRKSVEIRSPPPARPFLPRPARTIRTLEAAGAARRQPSMNGHSSSSPLSDGIRCCGARNVNHISTHLDHIAWCCVFFLSFSLSLSLSLTHSLFKSLFIGVLFLFQ